MNPVFIYKAGGALIGTIVLVVVIDWVSSLIYDVDRPPVYEQHSAAELRPVAPEVPAPEPVPEPAPAPVAEPIPVAPSVVPSGGEEGNKLAARLAVADPGEANSIRIRCVACHTFGEGEAHRVGPNLWNIVGRPVAATEGFTYSDALTTVGGNWTFAQLDAFLLSPQEFATGTRMTFPGVADAAARANLLLYLRDLSNSPVPLPGQ